MIFAPDIIPVKPHDHAVVGMGGVSFHIGIGFI